MATLSSTTQTVIDAIASRASATSATPNDMLYLAKAVQTLGSMSPSVVDVQTMIGALLAASSVEVWLATPANASQFTAALQNPTSCATLFSHAAAPAALFASSTATAAIFNALTAMPAVFASPQACTACLPT